MAFEQDKKPGFFGNDVSWTGDPAIASGHND
ncbi:hypothetical protein MicvaDRAFT_4370 [Microcoleus vaginatus FGP-2]|nr:hypothetical protein MicvaDRAFT_4370 [Microcoleus vaginatus FGP-2]